MKFKYSMTANVLFSLLAGLVISCTNESQSADKKQTKIDSLAHLYKEQTVHVKELESFITSLSQTMDSIYIQENQIVVEGDIEKRKLQSRETIINNLKKYQEIIERQKERLKFLENQLIAKNDEMSAKMIRIVSFYKKQLEDKDRTIASLQKNIKENKSNIKSLQTSVSNLLSTTQKQADALKEQENTLSKQSDMINICYVRIGTKKELKSAGLLSGGFLKSTKLNNSQLIPGNFKAMDMRECNDILLNSSNAKVLTQMPASSYSIIKNDNGTCYLHINDPNSFWSISRFLVIQL